MLCPPRTWRLGCQGTSVCPGDEWSLPAPAQAHFQPVSLRYLQDCQAGFSHSTLALGLPAASHLPYLPGKRENDFYYSHFLLLLLI